MKLRPLTLSLLITALGTQPGCAKKAGDTAKAQKDKDAVAQEAPRGVGSYEKGPKLPGQDKNNKMVARYVKADDSLFERPNVENGPWHRVKPTAITLLPQNITTPSKFQTSVASLEAQAVHNGKWLAVLVSWKDDSRTKVTATDRFSDAVAIGFPQGDPKATSPFMGGPGAGMEINFWKALWQRDIEEGYQDVTDLHPGVTADAYHGYQRDAYNTGPASQDPVRKVLKSEEARRGLPAVAMGNSQSQIERDYPVEQLMAEGFGTLTTQKTQDARAWGTYDKGTWTVVFTRPLDTGDKADAVFTPGKASAINFALWEGKSQDVGAKKNYAMFTPLLVEEKK